MSEYIKKGRNARLRAKYVHSEKHRHPYADFKIIWEKAFKKYPKGDKWKKEYYIIANIVGMKFCLVGIPKDVVIAIILTKRDLNNINTGT